MLNDNVKKYIEQSVLCWLATVTSDGIPNVSPKEIFAAEDDRHFLIAHIASPNSIKNIRDNPAVCVSFVDVFVQKGYKLTGHAVVINKTDACFEDKARLLVAMAGEAFPIHAIIDITVNKVEPILAPRYRLYPHTTEQDQIESALASYGVRKR